MAICFGILLVVLTVMTLLKPLPQPVNMPTQSENGPHALSQAPSWREWASWC